ncbi:hypothetical protein BCU94_04150 [Shewanella sp. 10N.286.52.C2]|nr:hypothetical protein BCU94_04150 [Shewanella sp. 10N.286.52.C2]PMH86720.1 hypothetical protein BCU57_11140 [Shewanella sp. 10N.286.48.B5]PMH95247.1 hypothetical protein BCU55_02840 [Shewanella sp. 10N.286.48.A6]
MKKHLMIASTLLLVGACSSTQEPQSTPLAENDSVPSWVLMPTHETGLASSSCVQWSGNMAASRAQAIANARADLAAQINTKAMVMDKLVNQQQQEDDTTTSSSSFAQVSKQIAEQSLVGAIPKEVAFARIDDQKQLCALVIMENTKPLFDKLIKESGKKLDPNDEAVLYSEFKTQKAMKELEAELSSAKKL